MAKKRYTMFIVDGMLNASESKLKNDPIFNPLSLALSDFFVRDLQRLGGGGTGWKGASWVLEESGLGIVSFQEFQSRVITGLNMQHNTGAANTQIATYSEGDGIIIPGTHPVVQFNTALLDVTRKPEVLEIVPTPLP